MKSLNVYQPNNQTTKQLSSLESYFLANLVFGNVMHSDKQFLVLNNAFNDGWEVFAFFVFYFQSAANKLRPRPVFCCRQMSVFMLMRTDYQLSSCFVQKRPPHLSACSLPRGIVCAVSWVCVGRRYVARIRFRVVVE